MYLEAHIGLKEWKHELEVKMEGTEAVNEAKAFLKKAKPDLTISDVPVKTLEEFKKFADNEFSSKNSKGHYGFALKHIWDFYKGCFSNAEAKADEALVQIAELRNEMPQKVEEKKKIRLVNGKELKHGGV